MNILLDTTIQIDRLLGSKDRKAAIDQVLCGNQLYSTTYVLGEYYKNIVTDCITLYSLFVQDKDIAETGKHITEKTFHRNQSRIQKLYSNIIGLCDYNIELIIDYLDDFLLILIDEFYRDLVRPLVDSTDCPRAKRKIRYEEGVPYLTKVNCRNDMNQCNICEFWYSQKEEIGKIISSETYEKIKDIHKKATNDPKQYKGNNCMTLGDSIIILETKNIPEDKAVCSSNKKDFEPICKSLDITLLSPDYGI